MNTVEIFGNSDMLFKFPVDLVQQTSHADRIARRATRYIMFNVLRVDVGLTCQATNSRYSKKFTIRLTEFRAI